MLDSISLSRAARLADVSRGDLQARLRKLELDMFEGMVLVTDLIEAYPEIDLDRDPMLERIALIREEAFANRGRKDSRLPAPEVLMSRLHDFQMVLTKTKASLNITEELLRDLIDGLHEALACDDATLRESVAGLADKMESAIQKKVPSTDREAVLFAKNALLSLMSPAVKLLPSGHEFFVAGKDSILEAAVKSGLHLNFGCSAGNCGECRVKLLRGEVRQNRDHDYVLSPVEKEKGIILACCHTAVTDLLIEGNEAHAAADLPLQEVIAQVRKWVSIEPDLTLIHVQTPRTRTLRFMAGQRVALSTEGGIERELPLAGCPCDARNLQFILRGGDSDPFVQQLLARGRPALQITGPFGDFLLQEESNANALFVSVGDGIAPIKSLVEHAIAIDNAMTLHLFRVDAIPTGSPIGNLCRSWHDALDNFTYTQLPPDTPPKKLLEELMQRFPRLTGCQVYIAAPSDWLNALSQVLPPNNELGAEGLHFESID